MQRVLLLQRLMLNIGRIYISVSLSLSRSRNAIPENWLASPKVILIFAQILFFTSRFVHRVTRVCGCYGHMRRECSATLKPLWISSYVVPDHIINCRSISGETDVTCYAPFPVNSVNIVDTLCCDQSGSSSLRGWLEAALVKPSVEGECCEYYILFEMIRRYSYNNVVQ